MKNNLRIIIPVIINKNAQIDELPEYVRINMYIVPEGTLLTIKYISLLAFAVNVVELDKRPLVILDLIKDGLSQKIALGAADFSYKTDAGKRCFVLTEAMNIQVPELTQVDLFITSTPYVMSMAEESLVGQSETFTY